MKFRQCDVCKKKIENDFIKCCKSTMEKRGTKSYLIQKLVHVGDICLDCYKKFKSASCKEKTK